MYKKILLAIDGSEHSIRAIEKAIELKKDWGCKVVMFHSIKHPIKPMLANLALASGYGNFYVSERELDYENRKAADALLQDRVEIFKNEELSVETRLIIDEAPEEYIEKEVEEEGFDLVIIGNRGIHSKLNQLLLGTVAQRVIKHAPCDVLIII